MIKRITEERDQLVEQRARMQKLHQLIESSLERKNATRHQVLTEMLEQHRALNRFALQDAVENQNRILRHITDFMLVLSRTICEQNENRPIIEPSSTEFLEQLRFIIDLTHATVVPIVHQKTNQQLVAITNESISNGSTTHERNA
jgi:uncharacterized membrane protein YccC